ncbi:Gfo/Idh/MocA family protein [Legionella clemsonensis]|uniref:Putative oxidoreductase YcjS n=1 Tax=Legionella clemsonensis TaxID=1867846 RepID=A0A222NYY8_9GAMM|nr:Gfo/Idh/MocA family oxidoreductase [Legionella clemsonensis]ASQ44765.1 putative oxidoreductase YcjS [Legionella clemsonensis]
MTATTPSNSKKRLSLGFIGVGWIGRSRMEALINQGNIKAVVIAEPCMQNASNALKMAAGARLVKSPEDVYKNEALDGIVIATPSALHASQSLEALKAGKAVFCQKPLGRTSEEVEQIINASKEADKLLFVDLSYRYTKAFQAIYDTIIRGEIGRIHAVNLVFHNAYGPDKAWFYDIKQSGGGCVIDLGVHLLDMALYCLGFPEVINLQSHLYSRGIKLKPNEEKVEDFAKIFMSTADETTLSLECSWNASAGQDAVIEVVFYGSEGGVALKNINGSFYDFKAEKYKGTHTQILVLPPDDWSGRTGLAWAEKIAAGQGYDQVIANEYLKTARIIDRIYGR